MAARNAVAARNAAATAAVVRRASAAAVARARRATAAATPRPVARFSLPCTPESSERGCGGRVAPENWRWREWIRALHSDECPYDDGTIRAAYADGPWPRSREEIRSDIVAADMRLVYARHIEPWGFYQPFCDVPPSLRKPAGTYDDDTSPLMVDPPQCVAGLLANQRRWARDCPGAGANVVDAAATIAAQTDDVHTTVFVRVFAMTEPASWQPVCERALRFGAIRNAAHAMDRLIDASPDARRSVLAHAAGCGSVEFFLRVLAWSQLSLDALEQPVALGLAAPHAAFESTVLTLTMERDGGLPILQYLYDRKRGAFAWDAELLVRLALARYDVAAVSWLLSTFVLPRVAVEADKVRELLQSLRATASVLPFGFLRHQADAMIDGPLGNGDGTVGAALASSSGV